MARLIVANQDEAVAQWVAARIPYLELGRTPYTAIGLMHELGELVAGVVFENYTTNRNIDMHLAAVPGGRWLSRPFLGEGFRYAFQQLECVRVTGYVPERNTAARRFDEHLGFVQEGRMRHMLPNGDHLIIYGMLRSECRWLKTGVPRGNRERFQRIGRGVDARSAGG